ncbi:unnamed protein product [Boreogadus saida]
MPCSTCQRSSKAHAGMRGGGKCAPAKRGASLGHYGTTRGEGVTEKRGQEDARDAQDQCDEIRRERGNEEGIGRDPRRRTKSRTDETGKREVWEKGRKEAMSGARHKWEEEREAGTDGEERREATANGETTQGRARSEGGGRRGNEGRGKSKRREEDEMREREEEKDQQGGETKLHNEVDEQLKKRSKKNRGQEREESKGDISKEREGHPRGREWQTGGKEAEGHPGNDRETRTKGGIDKKGLRRGKMKNGKERNMKKLRKVIRERDEKEVKERATGKRKE